jgi:hypothetical protein
MSFACVKSTNCVWVLCRWHSRFGQHFFVLSFMHVVTQAWHESSSCLVCGAYTEGARSAVYGIMYSAVQAQRLGKRMGDGGPLARPGWRHLTSYKRRRRAGAGCYGLVGFAALLSCVEACRAATGVAYRAPAARGMARRGWPGCPEGHLFGHAAAPPRVLADCRNTRS